MSASVALPVALLNAADFAPFGKVIEARPSTRPQSMNAGSAERFANLAEIDCAAQDGRAVISLVRAQPQPLPISLRLLERHPLGTQAFIPLSRTPFLVIVANSTTSTPKAFYAHAGQGVSYHLGTWHHPLLALERVSEFLVIDRVGPGDNCEEAALAYPWQIRAADIPAV